MLRKILVLTSLLVALVPNVSWAIISPVGVSLTPPLQFPPRGSTVMGMRLDLFVGVHEAVYGFDVGGVGNITDRGFGGMQVAGLFNRNQGPSSILGAQIAGIANWNINGGTLIGLQVTGGMNYNRGKMTFVGLGIGGGNRCDGKVIGAQVGIYNQAGQVYGLQIGLINVAKSLHGIQLGLVNINKSGMPFFPVVNIGF